MQAPRSLLKRRASSSNNNDDDARTRRRAEAFLVVRGGDLVASAEDVPRSVSLPAWVPLGGAAGRSSRHCSRYSGLVRARPQQQQQQDAVLAAAAAGMAAARAAGRTPYSPVDSDAQVGQTGSSALVAFSDRFPEGKTTPHLSNTRGGCGASQIC